MIAGFWITPETTLKIHSSYFIHQIATRRPNIYVDFVVLRQKNTKSNIFTLFLAFEARIPMRLDQGSQHKSNGKD